MKKLFVLLAVVALCAASVSAKIESPKDDPGDGYIWYSIDNNVEG